MQYTVNFRPIHITGKSKFSVHIQAISGHTFIIGGGSNYEYKGYSRLSSNGDKYIRVINYKKHRRVTKHDKNKNTKVISPAYWEAFIYDIPISFLKDFKLKLEQGKNNFTMKPFSY